MEEKGYLVEMRELLEYLEDVYTLENMEDATHIHEAMERIAHITGEEISKVAAKWGLSE